MTTLECQLSRKIVGELAQVRQYLDNQTVIVEGCINYEHPLCMCVSLSTNDKGSMH